MSWYIGVDPASRLAGLAALHENGEWRHTVIQAPKGEATQRFVYLRKETRQWLQQFADDGVWCCVVERPNTHGNATLLGAYGVLCEAVASSLQCAVMTVGPGEIDKLVFGTVCKPKTRKQSLLAYAHTLGYKGDSQDVADAMACALAAHHLTTDALRRLAA